MNANRVAVAMELLTGTPCTVLCVRCLHHVDPTENTVAKRLRTRGMCARCRHADAPELYMVGMPAAYALAVDATCAEAA